MFDRLLRVDLATGSIQKESIPEEYVKEFIGGSGLAVRLLWDILDPSLYPYDSPQYFCDKM